MLQIQHGELVPSLHAQVLNEQIDFERTPFYVQRELTPWNRQQDETGRELPRVAGISSFGAGGANAHVVVEEYLEDSRTRAVVSSPLIASPCLIVLSARTEERLRAYAQALRAALDDYTDADLAAIACTLQLGREAMEHRLACSVSSLDELKEKLHSFTTSGEGPGIHRGDITRHRESFAQLNADTDALGLVDAWLRKGKHSRLLALWTQGLNVDWSRLYDSARPRAVLLPTYPFRASSTGSLVTSPRDVARCTDADDRVER